MTNPQDLHIFILLTLHAVGDIGIRASDLLVRARGNTWPSLTLTELELELRCLGDRNLVFSYGSALGAQRWTITTIGSNALRKENLA